VAAAAAAFLAGAGASPSSSGAGGGAAARRGLGLGLRGLRGLALVGFDAFFAARTARVTACACGLGDGRGLETISVDATAAAGFTP